MPFLDDAHENYSEEIKRYYRGRAQDGLVLKLYAPTSPGNHFMLARRDWQITQALDHRGIFPLNDKLILDVGCGDGWQLRGFVDRGADPGHCYGIDLSRERIERAQYRNPNITFLEGSAESMPFPTGTFDLVTQFVAFSSMSPPMRRNSAAEIVRVLKEGGTIVWYDLRVRSPGNSHIQAISRREIARLFAGRAIAIQSHTLAPPLVRRLAPHSEIACLVLEKFPLLRTHYLALIS